MENNRPIKAEKIIITVVFTVLMTIVMLSGLYNKTWNLENNSLSALNIGLVEGEYIVTIDYKSQNDTGIFGYVTANDHEYAIWSGFIASSDSKDATVTLPFSLNFSIYNNSLHFITNDGISITKFSIKKSAFPQKELLCIIGYIILSLIIFSILKINKEDILPIDYLFVSLNYTLLYPIFMTNKYFLLIYIAFVALILFCKIKGWIQNGSFKVFLYYAFFSMICMTFFTTSSPLYPFNLCADENIYYAIGQGMFEGKTLYLDMFDHKGPCFFALYMLAYLISPGKYYGVYLIESILLALNLFCVYKISSRYMKNMLSHVSAILMLPFLLNSGYIGKGGSFEQMSISTLCLSMMLLLPEYTDDDENKLSVVLRYFLLGFIFSFIFFSKFNVSFAWLVLILPAIIRIVFYKNYIKLIKMILAYIGGVFVNIVWIVIYFKGNIKIPVEYYLLFNKKYGDITNLSDACIRIVNKVYSEMQKYPLSFVLIVLGLSVLVFLDKKTNCCGKVAVAISFVVLVGTTYAGHHSYAYYYSIIASYSFIGIITLVGLLDKILKYDIAMNEMITVGFMVFLLTFFINDLFLDSILMQKEPYPQDIFASQMNVYSPDDKSFFECGMMEWGFCSQAKASPYVQYFFYPNINESLSPEILNGQLDYIKNKTTQFIITYGFDIDAPPDIPGLNDNYHEISRIQYHKKTGESFWLYQRNN